VADVQRAVNRAWLRRWFDAIDDSECRHSEYRGAGDDEDFDNTWDSFVDVRAFYRRAAAAGHAVIFTATVSYHHERGSASYASNPIDLQRVDADRSGGEMPS
jgi:hypothetical protein